MIKYISNLSELDLSSIILFLDNNIKYDGINKLSSYIDKISNLKKLCLKCII